LLGCASYLGDRAQQLPAVAEQYSDIFEVLIRQIRENTEINPIFDKAAGVAGSCCARSPR